MDMAAQSVDLAASSKNHGQAAAGSSSGIAIDLRSKVKRSARGLPKDLVMVGHGVLLCSARQHRLIGRTETSATTSGRLVALALEAHPSSRSETAKSAYRQEWKPQGQSAEYLARAEF